MAVISQGQKRGAGGKWLFGCCGGCLGLMVVVAVVVGIAAYFMLRSRPVLPPETFLTAKEDAFVVGVINADDQALIAFLQSYARRQGQTPPKAEEITNRLESLTPLHVVLTARHTQKEGEFTLGGVVAIRGWSGLVRSLVNLTVKSFPDKGGSIEEYKGISIGTASTGVRVAAKDNNFMLADNTEMIKEWIDRIEEALDLEEGTALSYEGPAVLKQMYGRLDPAAQVRLVSSNEHGEIAAFLDSVKKARESETEAERGLLDEVAEAEIDWSNVSLVGGMLRLLDADTAGVGLLIECRSDQFAEGLRGAIDEMIGQQPEESALKDAEVSVKGRMISVKLKVAGIQQLLQNASQPGIAPLSVPLEPAEEPEPI